MWSLRNKSNSILAQKWHLFNHNHIRLVPVTSLVLIIVMMMMVSCASAQIKYPSETDKLVAQDSNTLLSPGFLPFLNECSSKNPPVQLCTMYYDMVYNAYQLGSMGNDTKLAIQKADQELDKPELIKEFCEIFRNETINTLDKQPFSQANDFNITQWIQIRPVCEVSCLQVSSNKPQPVEVKQVCKFISGGCRWISQQKKKLYLPNLLPQIPIPVPNQSGNGNYQPVDGKTQNLNGNEENKQQLKGSISASPVSNPNTMQNPPPNLLASNLNVKSSSSSNPALSKANSNLKTPDDTHVSKQIEISPPAAQQPSAQMPGNVTPPLNKTSPSNTIANKTGISNNIETKPVNAPLPPPPAPPKQTPPSLDNQSEDEAIDGDKKNELEDENQDNEGKQKVYIKKTAICKHLFILKCSFFVLFTHYL